MTNAELPIFRHKKHKCVNCQAPLSMSSPLFDIAPLSLPKWMPDITLCLKCGTIMGIEGKFKRFRRLTETELLYVMDDPKIMAVLVAHRRMAELRGMH